MSIAIIIHPDVQDRDLVLKSLIPSIQILNSDTDFNPSGLTRLGLMFHNELKCHIPFFESKSKSKSTLIKKPVTTPYSKIITDQPLKCYSPSLIDLLTKLVIQNGSFTLTLISCSMNSDEFLKETAIVQSLTGAKIEYSLNQTGNLNSDSADWILESNKENLIGTFFTDSILTWNHTLYYNPDNTVLRTHAEIINYFDTAGGAGTLTYSHGKFRLHTDVTIDLYDSINSERIHVMLNDNEVFDGHGHTLTYTKTSSNTRGLFIFNCKPGSESTIKNLKIASVNGASIYNGGGLVRSQQSNFIIKNCHNLSMNGANSYCGGLIGQGCNNFKIEKCTNSASVNYGNCGGIVGPYCTMFSIKNCQYLNNDNSIYFLGGGIVGPFCAEFTVTHCHNYVQLDGSNTGGIVGSQCYNFTVNNCKNDGLFTDAGQSGIVASQCLNFKVLNCKNSADMIVSSSGIIGPVCSIFEVSNCKNTGNVGFLSGGITASNCSNLIVRNCKNYGSLDSPASGGIVGPNTGNNSFLSANLYVKIYNCINYSQINAPDVGGIAGMHLGIVNSSNRNTTNMEIVLQDCINKGPMEDGTFTSGGICSSYLGRTSYPNGESATIRILNCVSHYGNLTGINTLFNESFSDGNNIPVPTKLIISDSYTSEKVSLIRGFSTTATDPENTCSAVYIKSNGKKVNLLRHPSFVSRK